MLLRLSDDGAEPGAERAAVRPTEPAPDRVAGSDARDPGAVRPLLPRPHERADARALAAADDGGAVRRSDASAEPAAVARTDSLAIAITHLGSHDPARARAHAGSDATAQLRTQLGAESGPVRATICGTIPQSKSDPHANAHGAANHGDAHIAHARADAQRGSDALTKPGTDARADVDAEL